jgi:heme/copper-type cytochrome/quinol oxidase subunit 2
LRANVVAAIGGLVVGHMLWLVAISLAMDTTRISFWVLVMSGVVFVVAGAAVFFARKFQERKAFAKSAFLWCLPVAPVLMTLAVLGVTYL